MYKVLSIISVIAISFIIASCGGDYRTDAQKANKGCKNHGGVASIDGRSNDAVCKDGYVISY
jgi:hypothetical protein